TAAVLGGIASTGECPGVLRPSLRAAAPPLRFPITSARRSAAGDHPTTPCTGEICLEAGARPETDHPGEPRRSECSKLRRHRFEVDGEVFTQGFDLHPAEVLPEPPSDLETGACGVSFEGARRYVEAIQGRPAGVGEVHAHAGGRRH